jgi:DNA-binding HxlR family transcriptional regulator
MLQPSFWVAEDEISAISPEIIGGKVGKHHPETSKKASARVRSGSQRYNVLEALYNFGSKTGWELSEHYVRKESGDRISPNQIATRLGELRELGLVKRSRVCEDGEWLERVTTSGNTAIVHEITLLGIETLMAERTRSNNEKEKK